MGLKENSFKMFVTLPLHGAYFPFSRIIILDFFCLLHSKLAQAREVGQLQNILKFLKSRNTELSYDMRSYGV